MLRRALPLTLAPLLLVVAFFSTPQPVHAADTDVVINEIHYDPDIKTEFSEFIELHNRGSEAVDLSLWYFDNGVSYTFPAGTILPAGGYFVLAEPDPNGTFTTSFQDVFAMAPDAVFTGKLSNEGEEITLRNSSGVKIDELAYELNFPWPITSSGTANRSLELIHPLLDNSASGNWRVSTALPTPKAQNSVYNPAGNSAPDVRKVEHLPQSPTSSDTVVVTAKVTDPEGVASVNLQYQQVQPGSYIELMDGTYSTNWTTIPMFDDGTNGDVLPADGIYTVQMPGSLQQHRHLIRYRIEATDTLGLDITAPYAHDTQPNFAYFVYNGVPNWSAAAKPGDAGPLGTVVNYDFNTLQDIPIYHLVTKNSEVNQAHYDGAWNSDDAGFPYNPGNYRGSEYPWYGTLVYNGRVYDHVRFRARGGVWRYAMGKNMWKFDFNKGHEFRPIDDYGEPYEYRWDKLNFSAVIQQGNFNHRGEQGLFEAVGFKMFNLTGLPAPETHFVHFRVVDDTSETGANQYAGDFWGLYLAVEQIDGEFLDNHELPDGNMYKMENWTGDLNNQGPLAATDKSDLNTFLFNYSGTSNSSNNPLTGVGSQQNNEAWWRATFNLEQYYNYRALVEGIHHYDIGLGKNYMYYLNPETNLWMVVPWDLDLTWDDGMYEAWNGSGPPYGGGEPFKYRTIYNSNIPAFNIEFQNRLREIRDLLYNSDQAWLMIDEEAAKIYQSGSTSFVDADRARWDYDPLLNNTSFINTSKAGHGRFYKPPGSSTQQNFAFMVTRMKNYVTSRSTWLDTTLLPDTAMPNTPTLTYVGTAGYPSDELSFQASAFADPQGAGTFSAMEWRLGEISYPGIAGHDPNAPWIYEITAVWESGELATYNNILNLPPGVARPGHTYRARVRFKDNSGRWSHWSNAIQFSATAPEPFPANALVITEFMYNPPGNDDVGYEFLELKNIHSGALDLSAVVVNGLGNVTLPINTTLNAGEFMVLAKNPAVFQTHYGFAPFNSEGYSGNLNNGGEPITIFDSGGITITSITYDDLAPWPTAPDAELGYSAVPRDPNAPTNNGADWRSSTNLGGSPGRDDPTLTAADNSVLEGNSGFTSAEITLTLSAANGQGMTTTVNFATLAGTATAGADYQTITGTLTILPGAQTTAAPAQVVGEIAYELDETVLVNLSHNDGLTDSQAVLTILNDDDPPAVNLTGATLAEGDSGLTQATLTTTLTAASGLTTTVEYATQAGTAAAGEDYQTVTGTLTFAPGQTSQTITVPVVGDEVYETDETLQVALSNPQNGTIGTGSALITIENDDAPPAVSLTDVQLAEGDSGLTPAVITLTLAATSQVTATVQVDTQAGTAAAGADYQTVSELVTFAPGQMSQTITVQLVGEQIFETDETVQLLLSNPQNSTISTGTATLTLQNDDAPPALTLANLTASEGNSGSSEATVTVELTGATELTATVQYTITEGTATAGNDFESGTGQLTFAPDQTSQTFNVTVLGDLFDEPNETVLLQLGQASSSTIGTSQATLTILDDDGASTLNMVDVAITEGDEGVTTATITVTLSHASALTITAGYSVTAGTATAGDDFAPAVGQLTFAPGQTVQTFTVQIVGDTLFEPDETVLLALHSAENGEIGLGEATLTIVNDDDEPPAPAYGVYLPLILR